MDAWIELKLKDRQQLTPNVLMLEFVPLHGLELPRFEAGAYIDVQMPGGMLRPYSLCNAPQDRHRYVIAVRRAVKSRGGSVHLHDRLAVGDALKVRHPLNEFPLYPSASHSVLFGGGVGVAPLLSMAEDLWHRGASFELHLSARNRENAPFIEHLCGAAYRGRVHLHLSELSGGRLDFDAAIKRISPLSHIYLCGPAHFMNAGIGAALRSGLPHDRVHIESFD